jgi:hypothetical protein
LSGVAAALAHVEPLAALEHAAAITDEFARREFVSRVFGVWAAAAPEAVIAYLAAPEGASARADTSILDAVAHSAPQRLLELADTLPSGLSYDLRLEAIGVLARRDAVAALDYIRTLESAGTRTGLTIAVAGPYARQSPDAALAWAESLSPPLPQARDAIIQAIAESDPDRGLDLALAEIAGQTRGLPSMVPSFISRMVTSRGPDAARVMTRLLDTPNTRILVDQALSMWMSSDREAATSFNSKFIIIYFFYGHISKTLVRIFLFSCVWWSCLFHRNSIARFDNFLGFSSNFPFFITGSK